MYLWRTLEKQEEQMYEIFERKEKSNDLLWLVMKGIDGLSRTQFEEGIFQYERKSKDYIQLVIY